MTMLFPINAYAGTDEDLLKIYNKSSFGVLRSELDKKLGNIQDKIEEIEQLQKKNKEYNLLVEQFNKIQQEKYNEVSRTISTYGTENNNIETSIKDNLFSIEPTELINYNSTYKSNVTRIDELITSLNEVYFEDYYKETDFDLDSFYAEIESINSEYEESIVTEDIGDVDNIKWIMPNDYYVTSKFGYRLDPITKASLAYHAGTDFRCSEGTEVGALFNGVVLDCGEYTTAGKYVVIQVNDRIKYFYCHLSDILVEKGQHVNQYDIVALSGNTGSRSTGPHLHIALYIDGSTVDVTKIFE